MFKIGKEEKKLEWRVYDGLENDERTTVEARLEHSISADQFVVRLDAETRLLKSVNW